MMTRAEEWNTDQGAEVVSWKKAWIAILEKDQDWGFLNHLENDSQPEKILPLGHIWQCLVVTTEDDVTGI